MYSRSYGSIENEKKNEGISIPADYNGSLYAKAPLRESSAKTAAASPTVEMPPKPPEPPPETPVKNTGFLGNLLERLTAEDILMYVLVFSLMKEDMEDPTTILTMILALLLL